MATVKVPEETSRVFPDPTLISLVAIVEPSTVPPLMSVVVRTELDKVTTPVEFAIDPAEVPSFALRFHRKSGTPKGFVIFHGD